MRRRLDATQLRARCGRGETALRARVTLALFQPGLPFLIDRFFTVRSIARAPVSLSRSVKKGQAEAGNAVHHSPTLPFHFSVHQADRPPSLAARCSASAVTTYADQCCYRQCAPPGLPPFLLRRIASHSLVWAVPPASSAPLCPDQRHRWCVHRRLLARNRVCERFTTGLPPQTRPPLLRRPMQTACSAAMLVCKPPLTCALSPLRSALRSVSSLSHSITAMWQLRRPASPTWTLSPPPSCTTARCSSCGATIASARFFLPFPADH